MGGMDDSVYDVLAKANVKLKVKKFTLTLL